MQPYALYVIVEKGQLKGSNNSIRFTKKKLYSTENVFEYDYDFHYF